MPTRAKEGSRWKCIWTKSSMTIYFDIGGIYIVDSDGYLNSIEAPNCVTPSNYADLFKFVPVPDEIKYKN